jgi:undecaprenyl-diphosphatase
MTFIHAIILGIVEGVTEFLPVSSTGHLILAGKLMGMPATDFLKSFEIIIQLGAILAVVVLYWKRLIVDLETWKRIVVAFIPTGILGLAFYKIIKTYLLGNSWVVVLSLFLGGIALIGFELWHGKRDKNGEVGNIDAISYKKSAAIGLAQSISMVPGISRSAATIVGGLFLGVKRETIVEFSFLLAVPTMAAATGLDLLKSAEEFSVNQIPYLLIGFIVSFFVAMASIKFLLNYIKNHTFIAFGIYRILIAMLFWFFVLR